MGRPAAPRGHARPGRAHDRERRAHPRRVGRRIRRSPPPAYLRARADAGRHPGAVAHAGRRQRLRTLRLRRPDVPPGAPLPGEPPLRADPRARRDDRRGQARAGAGRGRVVQWRRAGAAQSVAEDRWTVRRLVVAAAHAASRGGGHRAAGLPRQDPFPRAPARRGVGPVQMERVAALQPPRPLRPHRMGPGVGAGRVLRLPHPPRRSGARGRAAPPLLSLRAHRAAGGDAHRGPVPHRAAPSREQSPRHHAVDHPPRRRNGGDRPPGRRLVAAAVRRAVLRPDRHRRERGVRSLVVLRPRLVLGGQRGTPSEPGNGRAPDGPLRGILRIRSPREPSFARRHVSAPDEPGAMRRFLPRLLLLAVTACGPDGSGPVPPTIAAAGGDAQSGVVGTALAQPLRVLVTDGAGAPLSGVGVEWAITAGGGAVAPESSFTNAQGTAATTFTLGTAAGTQAARATMAGSTGSPVAFTATALAGPAPQLVKYAGDGQAGTPAQALPVLLAVRVQDQYGNGVAGIIVSWTVTVGGGTLSTGSVASGSTGIAQVSYTLGPDTGSNTVTATASGLAPVTFSATAVAQAVLVATVPIPPNYGTHDTFVRDGLAFVFAWNSGVMIYDVGNGVKGGTPASPQLVSSYVTNGGEVHNGWWFWNPATSEKKYLFIGQEGPGSIGASSSGDIQVGDVSNLNAPTRSEE